MKKALITGINGQDGSYLAELLLNEGYEVHGLIRRTSIENIAKVENLSNILDRIQLHICSLDNYSALFKIITAIQPDEFYHLAGVSYVSYSFEDEETVVSTNFSSTHYILSVLKEVCPSCRFYLAGSSEMYGNAAVSPQDENTRFNPRSIYGISKVASYHVVKSYRESHNMFACTGFTYNHESPRRGHTFVSRKITTGVAKIVLGMESHIDLGNVTAVRDWGYAPEYVRAMWLMLNNQLGPRDYVISTGIPHTVNDLLQVAFAAVGLSMDNHVRMNDQLFRPGEIVPLIGDFSKIDKELGWQPIKKFEEIIEEMVANDIERMRR